MNFFHKETAVASLLLTVVAVTCFNDGTDQTRYVLVNNHCPSEVSINVRCRSDSNDYGFVTVPPKGQYRFAVNIDVYKTGLYCDVTAGDEYGIFALYDTLRDKTRCTACNWDVWVNGTWGFPQESGIPDILFMWQ